MILNGLGFVSGTLYMFSKFFEGKCTERLLGTGITTAQINDDRIGNVLDDLHRVGLSSTFMGISLFLAIGKSMKFLFKLIPLLIPIALFGFLFLPKSDPAVEAQSQDCNLIRISDGDTIVCSVFIERSQNRVTEQIQSEEKIRFCGIDAPEISQPLGRESRQKLTDFLQGKEIIISPIERDQYGRLVAEVFVKISQQSEEELFINAEMVRSGLAFHYAQYSNSCAGRSQIVDAENEAKSKAIGVWASPNYERPWDYRRANRN